MGSEDFSLLRHLRALRRQLWLIALCLAAGVVAAAGVIVTQSSVYRASMKILVGQGGGAFAPANAGAVDPFAQTMANLLSSDVVATTAISDLRLKLTAQQLISHLAVTTEPQTAVLGVTYDSTDPDAAVRILRDTGDVFTRLVSPQSTGTGGRGFVSARVFDPAHLDSGRVSPRPARTLGLAVAFSLLIGIGLALARQAVKPRLDSPDQAEEWFQAPVMGTLPRGSVRSSPLAVWFGQTAGSERMRLGLAPLIAQLRARAGRVIVVTSVDGNDGNSALAAHLGAALASVGEHVVCVEVDDRPPTVIGCLGLADKPPASPRHGLLDAVPGRIEVQDAIQSVRLDVAQSGNGHLVARRERRSRCSRNQGASRLELLPRGALWSSAATAPAGDRLASLASTLSSDGRYVIVDAPPVPLFPQTLALALAGDTVLVVATRGSTTKGEAETVRTLLAPADPEKIGVVLVDPPSQLDWRPSPLRWLPRLPTRLGEPARLGSAAPGETVKPSAVTGFRRAAGSRTERRDPPA